MKLLLGDSLDVLKTLPENSVDACVTDPPAGISFMSKGWDSDKGGRDQWINWLSSIMKEVHRVLKPGAHALVWAIPRTAHWTGFALEDAGFEVRDCITHLFGSGFPKSHCVSKAIDKMHGAEREVVGPNPNARSTQQSPGQYITHTYDPLTKPATPEAIKWQGWGTALKPAAEFWWLIRKPLSEDTVAKNVLKWGTGALNIDGTRIGNEKVENGRAGRTNKAGGIMEAGMKPVGFEPKIGRFPSNLLLSHSEHCTDEQCDITCVITELDEQAGEVKSAGKYKDIENAKEGGNGMFAGGRLTNAYAGETGGPSRFFFQARPDEICYVCDELCSAQYAPKSLKERTENNSYAAEHVAVSGQQTSVDRLVSSGIHAFNVTKSLQSGQATTEVSAQETVQTNLDELKGLIAKSAGHLCEKCITYTAQKLAALKRGQSPELIAGPVSTIDYRKNILTQSLVSFAEPWANIDIIPTIQSLSILFGYVQAAIRKNIINNNRADAGQELGPSRFKYNSKVSSRERNKGVDKFDSAKIDLKECDADMDLVRSLLKVIFESMENLSIAEYGEHISVTCPKECLSTIRTTISRITESKTLSWWIHSLTSDCIPDAFLNQTDGISLAECAKKLKGLMTTTGTLPGKDGSLIIDAVPVMLKKLSSLKDESAWQTMQCGHPTLKPLKLMSYLCRLVTPPKGVILDPFMGSGSTGMAALKEGFEFVGIEREKEYFEIAEKRIASVANGEA